jgi:ribosomal protein L16 Arg81 hydroxylase
MAAKQIDVTCPCCSSVLTVDVLTSKVMLTRRAREQGGVEPSTDRWDKAQERVRERTQKSADKLESALEDERTKSARFDELFKKAHEKHTRKSDET